MTYCTTLHALQNSLLVMSNGPAVGAMELLRPAVRRVTEQRPSTVMNLTPCPYHPEPSQAGSKTQVKTSRNSPTAKSSPQGCAVLALHHHTCIVQGQALHSIVQRLKVCA